MTAAFNVASHAPLCFLQDTDFVICWRVLQKLGVFDAFSGRIKDPKLNGTTFRTRSRGGLMINVARGI
jgi:hypothetical protein